MAVLNSEYFSADTNIDRFELFSIFLCSKMKERK